MPVSVSWHMRSLPPRSTSLFIASQKSLASRISGQLTVSTIRSRKGLGSSGDVGAVGASSSSGGSGLISFMIWCVL